MFKKKICQHMKELFHGFYKVVVVFFIKSCLSSSSHQVVPVHSNSSSRSTHHEALILNLVIIQMNRLTFLMACTWWNMTFAPEGKEREGTLGWHFSLLHFYNQCTMKVNFMGSGNFTELLTFNATNEKLYWKPQSALMCWNKEAYGLVK